MTDIVKMIDANGLWVVLIAVLVWASTPALRKFFELKVESLFKNKKKITQEMLLNHSFFSSMQYWLDVGIEYIRLQDKGRQEIVKDFLRIKFIAFRDAMVGVIKNPKVEEMHREELRCYMMDVFTETIGLYEQRAVEAGIPMIFVRKFADWHSPEVKSTKSSVSDICISPFYDYNPLRLNSFLDMLSHALNKTILHAEQTLNSLNGDLSGLEYNGFKVGH